VTVTLIKVVIALIVGGFVAVCYLWKRPLTDLGKVSRRLCALNAVGWVIVLLPWSTKGHPPTVLFPIAIFWLLNFILLPVIGLLLWVCRSDHDERKPYVATAALYLALNITVLYIVPFISLALGTLREFWER